MKAVQSKKRLNVVLAAAVFAVPLQAFVSLAHAAEPLSSASAAQAESRPLTNAALLASGCVSLQTQRPISRNSFNRAMPALVNQCSYPVTVAYCVDDRAAGASACQAAGAKRPAPQLVEPRAAVDLQMSNSATLYEKIRWVACRSEPGVTSQLNDAGTGGGCVAASSLRADAQPMHLSR